ncbi:MAG: UpxY family transcription antiterminator [Bacteroidota bacterium]
MSNSICYSGWYAGYTYPKAERKVFREIELKGVEVFLPLCKVVRQWSDRKRKVEVPLFPSYVFVYATRNSLYELLRIRELVRIVSFEGKFCRIPDPQIESIRKLIEGNIPIQHEDFVPRVGSLVRVEHGPLKGVEGTIKEIKGKSRLIIQILALGQAVSIDISKHHLKEVAREENVLIKA